MIAEERILGKFSCERGRRLQAAPKACSWQKRIPSLWGIPLGTTLRAAGEGASLMPRCAGLKRDGGQCTTIVKPPQTHCYQHDPARAGERKRDASKAARSPAKGRSNSEIREVKAQLEDLYTALLEGS